MKTVALIPAYNEEDTCGGVISRTKKYADCVIVIDDGSTDNTAGIAKKAGAEVVSYKQNQGKSHALMKGIELLNKYNPEIVILIDADGQHLPEEIPRLTKPIIAGEADAVYGVRKFRLKQVKSWFPGKIVDLLFGGRDILCGFKAIKCDALKKLGLSKAEGYLFELVLHREIKKNKLKLVYVPVTAIGITRINWLKGLKLGLKYIFGG